MKKWISVLLSALFLLPYNYLHLESAQAADTLITKKITVKKSDGTPYQGAQVALSYVIPGENFYTLSKIEVSDGNGITNLSYPSTALNVNATIQPPENDTNWATGALNGIDSTSGSSFTYTLKPASVKFRILNADGSDGAEATILYIFKDWINLVRSGTFYLSADQLENRYGISSLSIDSRIRVNIRNRIANNLFYTTQTTENGVKFSFYSDKNLSIPILASDGAINIQYRKAKLELQLQDYLGNDVSIPNDSNIYAYINAVDSNLNQLSYTQTSFSGSTLTSDGKAVFTVSDAGRYLLTIISNNSESIPSAEFSNIWLNETGQISTTSSTEGFTSGSEIPILKIQLPEKSAKFQIVDSKGNTADSGCIAILEKKNGVYAYREKLLNNICIYSKKSTLVSLPDGEYKLSVNTNVGNMPSGIYYLKVTNSVYELYDETSKVINAINSIFKVTTSIPNLQIKVSTDSKVISGADIQYSFDKNGYSNYTNEQGEAFFKLEDGEYTLTIRPNDYDSLVAALTNFKVVLQNGQVASMTNLATNQLIKSDSNNYYNLILSKPTFTANISFPESDAKLNERYLQRYQYDETYNYWKGERTSFTNSEGKFGDNPPAGRYRYTLSQNQVSDDAGLSLNECNVINNQPSTCTIKFPAVNLILSGYNYKGEKIQDRISYSINSNLFPENNFYIYGTSDPATNLAKFRLPDGPYTLTMNIPQNIGSQGASNQYVFTVKNGQVAELIEADTDKKLTPVAGIFEVSTKATNFDGQVTYNGLPVTSASINAEPINGSGRFSNSYTSSTGKFSLYLADGDYNLNVEPSYELRSVVPLTTYRVSVKNKAIVSFKNSANAEISTLNGIYPITFDNINVSGTVKVGNQTVYGDITARPLDSSGKWFSWSNKRSVISASSKYGMKLEPGKYVFNFNGTIVQTNKYFSSITDICEVPATGEVTCDISFPAVNLKIDVKDSNNKVINSGYWITVNRKYENGASADSCCVNSQSTPKELSLLDGDYQISINPDGTLPIELQANTYDVKIESGSVKSIIETKTGKTPDLENQVYILKFASPGVQGVAVGPDGTTPVPRIQVQIRNQRMGYGTNTNSAGRFAFQILDDGIYDVIAMSNWNDISLYDSETQKVSITGGKAPNDLTLKLRQPNIVVTVRGPDNLPSANNWVNIQKKDQYGVYQYDSTLNGRLTNSLGQFAYYLSPGTYIFEAQADVKSGGVRTISSPCEISATIPNCDFNLLTSNLKVKIKDTNGNALSNAGGLAWLNNPEVNSLKRYENIWSNLAGNAQAFLPNGTWSLRIDPPFNSSSTSYMNYEIEVSGGVVQSVKDSLGTVINQTDGEYVLVLPTTNLNGIIKFGNQKVNYWNTVSVLRQDGDNYYQIDQRGTNNGEFGFKVEAGKYRIQAQPSIGSNSKIATTRSAICEVAKTGSTTCNVDLLEGNLLGQIRASDNSLFRDFYANLFTKSEQGENWYQPINLYDGNFTAYLENGTYRLNVAPYWDKRSLYSEHNYEIKVSSNAIVSAIDLNTNLPATKNGDYYLFTLNSPGIKGSVYEPGTSTTKVPNIQVVPLTTSGIELWQYSTQSDANGDFGLALPPGTYDLVARVWSKTSQQTSSAKTRIIVDGSGMVADPITLKLRAPNLFGTVVKPNPKNLEPLSNVGVNIFMNGEWFYTWTEADGKFGAYIEGAIPANCSNCWINLNPWGSPDYSPRNYTFSTLGDLSNLEVGGVNSRVRVKYPASSNVAVSKWTYVAVEEYVSGNPVWQPGAVTNESGLAGLSLKEGVKYRLTAYPDWQKSGDYSPKSVIIENFSPATSSLVEITFDDPNVTFTVKNSANILNSWARYEIYSLAIKVKSESNPDGEPISTNPTGIVQTTSKVYLKDSYLNSEGKGSQALSDGYYELKIYPGKASGSIKYLQIYVNAGVATQINVIENAEISVGVSALSFTTVLPNGNFSGKIKNGANVVSKASVVAVSGGIKAAAITDEAGNYELNLDATLSWSFSVVDPISGFKNTTPYVYTPQPGALSDSTIILPDIEIS